MLKQFLCRRGKAFYLGVQWQADRQYMVLLRHHGRASKNHKTDGFQLIHQWALAPFFAAGEADEKANSDWVYAVKEISELTKGWPLKVNVGLANNLCHWLHCPPHSPGIPDDPSEWVLDYQRTAAQMLNSAPSNLSVQHLQLAPNLSFLVATKSVYISQIQALLAMLEQGIKGQVLGWIQPQGLSNAGASLVFKPPVDVMFENASAFYLAILLGVKTLPKSP